MVSCHAEFILHNPTNTRQQNNKDTDIAPGTEVFFAPENFKKKFCNPLRMQVWALGIILYQLLEHDMPFHTADEILHSRVVFTNASNHVSREGRELCRKLLSKNEFDRPDHSEILYHSWFSKNEDSRREAWGAWLFRFVSRVFVMLVVIVVVISFEMFTFQ